MHPLLQRQIDRTLGDEPRSPAIEALLDRVAQAYEQADADRAMLERALDLSSHELVDANRGLRQAVDLLETTLESTEDGLLVVDTEGRVVRTNERFLSVWELTQDDLSDDAGALMSVLSERLVLTGDLAALLRDAQEHPEGSFSAVLSLKGDRFLQVGSRPQKQGREEGGGRVWSFHDLTEIKRAESTIRHFAYHDPLTDLPNRALLNDRLSIAMARARRANTSLGLFFIDLDHFKHINDSLGHGAGDRVLVQVATRLERVRRSCDTLARFGGDEFVLVVQDLGGRGDFELVARRILEALNRPFEVEGHALHVSASVGVALFPEDALDEETLIRKADTALYAAKDMGRDTFEVFSGEKESVNLERILLQNALRAAVEDDRFYIEIQPIVCGTTGRVLAGEALCRWNHRDRRISPVTFIPMAEEAGIIDQLGLSVLRQGLEQCAAWRAAGHDEVRLSINVSPLQLHRPDFIRRMCALLEDEDLPRSILQVELTESTLIEGGERGIDAVRHLAAAGFSVALDDFGTGYSSLGNLRRLPLTALKIDRTFVQSCGADARDAEFVRTIVSLGHSLDLQVIAEGVETADQYRVLAQAGCDALQGFGLARPLPAAEFLGRLDEPSLLTPLVGSVPV